MILSENRSPLCANLAVMAFSGEVDAGSHSNQFAQLA
jgi:hypothetical protein